MDGWLGQDGEDISRFRLMVCLLALIIDMYISYYCVDEEEKTRDQAGETVMRIVVVVHGLFFLRSGGLECES